MDTETREILVKLLEGQTRLETEMGSMKSDIGSLKSDVSSLKSEMGDMKSEIRKNSIKLESIENKLDIIAEVQVAHKEQDERSHKNFNSTFLEKTEIIELSTKNISNDIKDVKESVDVLKDMTGRHEVDINILKRRPV